MDKDWIKSTVEKAIATGKAKRAAADDDIRNAAQKMLRAAADKYLREHLMGDIEKVFLTRPEGHFPESILYQTPRHDLAEEIVRQLQNAGLQARVNVDKDDDSGDDIYSVVLPLP